MWRLTGFACPASRMGAGRYTVLTGPTARATGRPRADHQDVTTQPKQPRAHPPGYRRSSASPGRARRGHPQFTPHISRLCSDLTGLDALLHLLDTHIESGDDGVFPTAATALDGPAWAPHHRPAHRASPVDNHRHEVAEPRGTP